MKQTKEARFAKKSLGQNFLSSTDVRDGILREAGDLCGKHVLEIGPGLGFLTEKLLEAGALVTAVELDERAVQILNKKFDQIKNFTLVHGDILQQDLDKLFTINHSPLTTVPYCVIANIPYNITGPIIRKLLEKTQHKPEFCLLMVQKEVAHKICDPQSDIRRRPANPPLPLGEDQGEGNADKPENKKNQINKILSIPLQGQSQPSSKLQALSSTPKRSILSISVEVYAQAKYCFTVGREHFEPSPKVDSAIIKLTTRLQPLITPEQNRDFFTVVNAGFSEKRKKIGNVLGKFFGVEPEQLLGSIDGNRRAETLEIDEWLEVTENFRQYR